tara:strand:+ start:2174 stop:3145 length:972 start_codon:yes stop_codon:yes gene_type:complete
MIKKGKNINYASQKLKENGLVAIPTETVYGLAGNALNYDSVNKIFKLKKRPKNDPLICHTNSIEKIIKFVKNVPDKAEILAKKFWPGPLTIIFEKNKIIPDITTSNLNKVAFRIPNKSITLKLLEELPFPLAAPSANIFSYISPTKVSHIYKNFSNNIDYILDGGDCSMGIESTIISFDKDEPIIHRLGSLTTEDIERVIGKVKFMNSNDKFPGSFHKHYAPIKKLYVGDIDKLYDKFKTKRIGLLSFNKEYDFISKKNQIILSRNSSLKEATKNLYSALYELDNMKDIDLIITGFVNNKSLGKTINDRLIKSSYKYDRTEIR